MLVAFKLGFSRNSVGACETSLTTTRLVKEGLEPSTGVGKTMRQVEEVNRGKGDRIHNQF